MDEREKRHGQNAGFTASRLTEMGLFPFPLKDHDSMDSKAFKRPRAAGWQNKAETASSVDLSNWDARRWNLGLSLGPSRLVVLDSDTAEAEAWAEEHLPATPWKTRTSHGFHRFYRLPEGAQAPTNGKPIPGMDRKAAGGYVLAPGSWHFANGVNYQAEGDWAAPIDSLPVYDPTWFPAKGEGKPEKAPAHVAGPAAGRPENWHDRVGAFLRTCEPSIQTQDGSGALLNTCLKLYTRFGLDEAEVVDLVQEHYNVSGRCEPLWSLAEVQHKATDANRTAGPDRWPGPWNGLAGGPAHPRFNHDWAQGPPAGPGRPSDPAGRCR